MKDIYKFITIFLLSIICFLYLIRGMRTYYYYNSYHSFDVTPSLVGTKFLLLDGIDPYSIEGERLIEIAYFGRELTRSDSLMRQRFFYPLYVIFFYYPFIYLSMAKALFIIYLLSFLICVLLCLVWTNYIIGIKGITSSAIMIFFLLSPTTYSAIQNRQALIISFMLLTVAVYFILYKSDQSHCIVSGMLLFLATIKPQSSILAICYILLILLPSISNQKTRINVFYGFLIMAVFSLIVTNVLVPGWVTEFLQSLREYRSFAETGSGAEKLFGKGIIHYSVILIFIIIGIYMIIICYKNNNKYLHLVSLSYLLNLQGLIFPSFGYVLIMGIPMFALGVYQLIYMQRENRILSSIILFNFILILYFTASQFLIQFSNVLAKMININYAYLIFFPFKTPFYILLFILSLGVSLFLVNYKSRTNLVLTTNL